MEQIEHEYIMFLLFWNCKYL